MNHYLLNKYFVPEIEKEMIKNLIELNKNQNKKIQGLKYKIKRFYLVNYKT